jgi:hypothetical protein
VFDAKSGAVATAYDAGHDLEDDDTVICVIRIFGGLEFPPPDGGAGRIVALFTLIFSPGD